MPALWRFLIPSSLGVLFFLLPVHTGEKWTIVMGWMSDRLIAGIGDDMPGLLLAILTLSGLLTPLVSWFGVTLGSREQAWQKLFRVEPLWVVLRIAGAITGWLIHLKVGPEFIWHSSTGGVAFYALAGGIVTIFFFAAFLLPFLTDYGFMEFIGISFRRVFRFLFRLPGRSAIDATASWLAAAAVGILITIQQYEKGFYSQREAAIIATNFSITSLPFCVFVIGFIGMDQYFFEIYGTVVLLGVVAAIIVPRLPPLVGIPDKYHPEMGRRLEEEAPEGESLLRQATEAAVVRAASGPGFLDFIRIASTHVLDIWFGLLPAVVLIGTLGMALAEFTDVMSWLSAPLVPVLNWLQLPEASEAAPAMLVGFLDMFLPAAVAQDIQSELTRFVIACVSLTQLIYMSEVGVILIRSPIALGFRQLVAIFLIRTALVLPISALIGHLLF